MHFVSCLNRYIACIIPGSSKSVQDYFVKYPGRITVPIEEFVPEAYLGPKDLYNLLTHYFGVPNSPQLLDSLKQFQGRALFFLYHFFFKVLLPALEKKKPSSGNEVAAIIFEILRSTGEAQSGCREQGREIVKHFYHKMGQSKDVIRAVEVSVCLCAGWMNRQLLEVTKQSNQILSFVSGEKCFITEPFILEALSHRNTHIVTDPNDDTIFQICKEYCNEISAPKKGKTIGALEVLIARCFQRLQGARFGPAFSEAI